MPDVNQQFRDVVGKWANTTVPEQLKEIAVISIQDTAEIVVDETPVDTGFLVGNWQPSLDAPEFSTIEGASGYDASAVGLVLADMQLGQMFYFSNNAVYARRINWGFVGYDALGRYYNQSGVFMIETAIGQWSDTVEKASAEVIK